MQVIFLLQNNMCMLECHGAAVSQGEPAVVVIKLQRFRVYTLRSATERNACVVRVSVNGGLDIIVLVIEIPTGNGIIVLARKSAQTSFLSMLVPAAVGQNSVQCPIEIATKACQSLCDWHTHTNRHSSHSSHYYQELSCADL